MIGRGGRQGRPQVIPFPFGPLREVRVFPTVEDALAEHTRSDALPLLFPQSIEGAARDFAAGFPGRVLYAVKSNPHPTVLRAIFQAGVRDFDIASLAELRMVQRLGDEARAHFMHPIKAREAIRTAFEAGVRSFVADSLAEVAKIRQETGDADVLTLVRLAIHNEDALYKLAGKFGAEPDEAVELLQAAAGRFGRVGICFHVGSQCMSPDAFARAIALAADLAEQAAVPIRVLDIGGGFPARYPDMTPPPLGDYFARIVSAVRGTYLEGARLWAEPGRALVADGGATLARVEGRRRNDLYLNDGIFGTLFDAGVPAWRFPVRRLRATQGEVPMVNFRVFGPSCDSADVLTHEIALPADTDEGDWIEFGQLGAYGTAFQSRFNGFRPARPVAVLDAPLIDRITGDTARTQQ